MKLVSVIIPVYNVLPYLEKCVQSVLAQYYQNLEIILVDDGATDGSAKLCDKLSRKDSRIKVIHKNNGGLSAARNTGINIANGSYYFFVDSDDYIYPETINSMVRNAITNNADLVVCGYNELYKNRNKIEHTLPNGIYNYDEFWELFFQSNNNATYILPWNKLYRSEIFKNCSFSEGKINEDEFIIEQVISSCKKISFVEKPLYNYIHRESSITNTKVSVKNLDAVEAFQNRIDSFELKNKNRYALKTLYMVPGVTSRLVSQIPKSQKKEMKDRLIQIRKKYIKQSLILIKKGTLSSHLVFQFLAFMLGPTFYNKVIARR